MLWIITLLLFKPEFNTICDTFYMLDFLLFGLCNGFLAHGIRPFPISILLSSTLTEEIST